VSNRIPRIARRRLAYRSALCINLSALAVLSAWSVATAVEVRAQEAVVHINLPAQSLDESLIQLGRQTSLQFFYTPDTVAGLTAPAVNGAMTPEQALQRLLQGAPVQYGRQGNNVTLSRVLSGASQLPVVVVQGALDASSEGSGSYAAKAVTIGKSAQTLKEIPQSVSVLTRQQMDDLNLQTTQEALVQTPGVILSGYDGQEGAIIRGFDANSQINGVPIQSGGPSNNLLAQYDRIEVLRGPSGLLTGTGEPGGTINYVSKRALDTFALNSSLTLGSWNQRNVMLDITGPLNDAGTLRARGIIAYLDKDMFYDVGQRKQQLYHGTVEYDLTPRTTATLTATYNKNDWTVNWGLPFYTDGRRPGRSAFAGTDALSHDTGLDVNAGLEHRFDNGWTVNATYQYGQSKPKQTAYYGSSLDATTGLNIDGSVLYQEMNYTYNSFDVHASGPFSLFDRTHTLTVGYNKSERDYRRASTFTDISGWDVLNNHNMDQFINRNLTGPWSNSITEQSGFYGSGRFKLADPLTLVVGARLSDYSSKNRSIYSTYTTNWNHSRANTSNKLTPYGGVVWDVNSQLTWYASYADTFVPQTALDANSNVLDPRIGWQIETGIKASFFEDRLSTTFAVFRIEDKNRAMAVNNTGICPDCSRAAGKVRSQGWEVEVIGKPMPLLDIAASYTYNHSKYLTDSDPANVGERFNTEAPLHLFKLWGQYRFAESGWNAGAGLQAFSRYYSSTVDQGGYSIVNAKVGYRINKNWDANLFVNNLFDRTYLKNVGSFGSWSFSNNYGDPRNFQLTLNGRF
jgi:outer membrane receptor for ferric coprogen and ferric-rhodotorulic acid